MYWRNIGVLFPPQNAVDLIRNVIYFGGNDISTPLIVLFGYALAGVAVLKLGDGRRFLRLDDLRTSNGPDLFVYLSVTPADGQRDIFDDNFVSLGRLKGNQGNQNYEIAAGVDLRRYQSVVIWCRRFTYAFGAAPLH